MQRAPKPLVFRVRPGALDDPQFSLGIMRLSTQQRVTYMNRAVASMVGSELAVGDRLSDLALDPVSRATLDSALHDRFEDQRGSAYSLQLRRTDEDVWVKLRVSALPEYDTDGLLLGSIAFLSDESLEAATLAIHEAIQAAGGSAHLYAALSRQLHHLIAFDSLVVTGISRRRMHLQRLFEDPPPPEDVLPTKWWPMQPFVKAMFDDFQPGPMDLDALFARPDFAAYAHRDPAVQQFRARGFRHSLRLGVYEANELVATVSLMRRADRPFGADDLARCRQLPIVEAVHAAMTMDRHRDLQFGLEFVNHIAEVADSMAIVAQRLVDQLARHYGWEHVSLFRVDEDRRRLRMICQAGGVKHRLPQGYEQPFGTGILGLAHKNAKAVNVGDISASSMQDLFLSGIADTRSELVLPVPGSKLRWLLNIEASLRDAFADEEQASVELLLRVAGFILDRAAMLELKSAVLRSVADAVIVTDAMGVIQDANPAALGLLRHTPPQLLQRNISVFIADDADALRDELPSAGGGWGVADTGVLAQHTAAAMLQADCLASQPVDLRRSDGVLVPVLLSVATLPADLGGKVFVATDLSQRDRVERLELLKLAMSKVAAEIRVPLGLAAAFLSEGLRTSTPPPDLIDKSLRQIRAADLPLERVVRLAGAADDTPLPCSALDLRGTIEEIVAQLPQGSGSSIRVVARGDAPVPVHAARHELSFCVQSILAHLLQAKSQAERVDILVGQSASRGVVLLTTSLTTPGDVPPAEQDGTDPTYDLSLAAPVVASLMHRMGGSYHVHAGERPYFRLVMQLGGNDGVAATDRP